MISVSTAHLRTNLLDAAVFLSFYPLMELVEFLHYRRHTSTFTVVAMPRPAPLRPSCSTLTEP